MPQAKFSKVFDYRTKHGGMTAYPSGYEGDIPQAHYDAALEAGALEGATAKGGATGGDTKAK